MLWKGIDFRQLIIKADLRSNPSANYGNSIQEEEELKWMDLGRTGGQLLQATDREDNFLSHLCIHGY